MTQLYKRVVIVFLAFLLSLVLHLLVFSWASAQTPLPTDTPAPTPVFDCPDPGVITDTTRLDPEWAVLCAFCFTTPTPTSIYQINQTPISTYAIGTPSVTGTPGCYFQDGEWICPTSTPQVTPSPTITPTPSVVPDEYYIYSPGFYTWSKPVNANDEENVVWHTVPAESQLVGVAWIGATAISGSANLKWGEGTSGYVPGAYYIGGGSGNLVGDICAYSTNPTGGTNPCDWLASEWPVAWDQFWYLGSRTWHTWLPGVTFEGVWSCSNWYSEDATCAMELVYIYYGQPPEPTPTPGPSPTPTPGGVDCSEPAYRDDTPAVEVEGVEYLGTTCPIEIPEYSIEIPEFLGFGGIYYDLPGATICVDWYSFPSMTIFEVVFSGAVAFLPLIIFAVIFIMRV